MSNFDENVVNKLKRLEREIERLKTGSEKALPDGWIPVSSTWTYASATTITVPSGAAAIYKVGQGVRVTANGVVLQAYIVGVADTLLTTAGDALTNHTFSAISYTNTPGTAIGFPVWFNWVPNFDPNGTGAVLSGYSAARFSVSERTVNFTFIAENKAMTTRGGICLIGLPVTASALAVAARMYASIYPIGGIYIHARCDIIASSAFMSLHKDFTYSAWVGNETGLYIYISGFYEI